MCFQVSARLTNSAQRTLLHRGAFRPAAQIAIMPAAAVEIVPLNGPHSKIDRLDA